VSPIGRLKRWARRLKVEVYALYLAYKDPRVPWYARAFAAVVVAYAFSPIDLIPDPIPILGYLDDLVIIPLGVALAIRMIPPPVLVECREEARDAKDRPVSRGGSRGSGGRVDRTGGVGRMVRGAGVLRPFGEAGCMCYDLTAG
jgi:uncharacterized membrane protein YkvA (DUF1232 family)